MLEAKAVLQPDQLQVAGPKQGLGVMAAIGKPEVSEHGEVTRRHWHSLRPTGV